MASPFVELEGKSIIQSSSGYISIIDYSGRGYFSGKKNSFKARIYKNEKFSNNKENALYTITGQWSGKSIIYKGSSTNSKNFKNFYDAKEKNPEPLIVKPIEEQKELESRKAWYPVANAIRDGNFELIHKEKSKLENNQRLLRKKELELNLNWKQRFFIKKNLENLPQLGEDSDPLIGLSQLCNLSRKNVVSGTIVGDKDDKGDDYGHWRFNRNAWDNEEEYTI